MQGPFPVIISLPSSSSIQFLCPFKHLHHFTSSFLFFSFLFFSSLFPFLSFPSIHSNPNTSHLRVHCRGGYCGSTSLPDAWLERLHHMIIRVSSRCVALHRECRIAKSQCAGSASSGNCLRLSTRRWKAISCTPSGVQYSTYRLHTDHPGPLLDQ